MGNSLGLLLWQGYAYVRCIARSQADQGPSRALDGVAVHREIDLVLSEAYPKQIVSTCFRAQRRSKKIRSPVMFACRRSCGTKSKIQEFGSIRKEPMLPDLQAWN